MKLDVKNIQIKMNRFQEGDLKAMISLNFGDFVLRGFRLRMSKFSTMDGHKELWFTPPTYQSKGKFHPIFFMPDKELWKQIEAKVLKEYEKTGNEVNEDDLI